MKKTDSQTMAANEDGKGEGWIGNLGLAEANQHIEGG